MPSRLGQPDSPAPSSAENTFTRAKNDRELRESSNVETRSFGGTVSALRSSGPRIGRLDIVDCAWISETPGEPP